MTNVKAEALRGLARRYAEELAGHAVLGRYWPRLSVVLKGGAAREWVDEHSDIDLVVFADAATVRVLVDDHRRLGLTRRDDGVFLPLGDWEGHYHLESLEHLEDVYRREDIPWAWEYLHALPLHDPGDQFAERVRNGDAGLRDGFDAWIRRLYLDIQLNLDWLRQPLRRADRGASLLYAASVLRLGTRMLFLLEGRYYPCDKWLFHYARRLDAFPALRGKVLAYAGAFAALAALEAHKPLGDYPVYAQAADWVDDLRGCF